MSIIRSRTTPMPAAERPASFSRYLRRAAARRRRASGSSTRYTIVVFLLWYLPGPVFGAWQGLTGPPPTAPVLTSAAGMVLLVAAAAAVGWASTVAGPISASREWRAWVLSTPLPRGWLLRRRAVAALGLAVVPGVLIGALIADVVGVRGVQALAVIAAAAFAAVTAAAVAICWQRRSTARSMLRRWHALIAVPLIVAVPVSQVHTTRAANVEWWTFCVGTALAALIACWFAAGAVGSLPMTALTGGAGSGASILAAFQEQSLAPLSALLATPNSRRRSHTTYRPLTGTGQKALVSADRRRTLRNHPALTRWAAMACLPYIAIPLVTGVNWARPAIAVITFTAATAAISGLCSTARQLSLNPSLATRYGLDRDASKRTAMAVPYVGAVLWGAVTAPAVLFERPAILALVIPVAALAVVEYRAGLSPYQPTYLMGQQYPLDLTRRLTQGPAQYAGALALIALLATQLT